MCCHSVIGDSRLDQGNAGRNQVGQRCYGWVVLQDTVVIRCVTGRNTGWRQGHNFRRVRDGAQRDVGQCEGIGQREVGAIGVARFQCCCARVDDRAQRISDGDICEVDVTGVGDGEGVDQLVAIIRSRHLHQRR